MRSVHHGRECLIEALKASPPCSTRCAFAAGAVVNCDDRCLGFDIIRCLFGF